MARTTQRKSKVDNKSKGKVEARRAALKFVTKAKSNLVVGGAAKKVASLDMLAEVASATLKRGGPNKQKQRYATRQKPVPQVVKKPVAPAGNVPETTKDVMRRVSQGESLNLNQIRILSDKLLLNVFAEYSSDEIRRSYTYSCYMMPDRCKQKYNSFGNETSARLLMKGHLLGHISELMGEENSSRKPFVAEPVFTRKKRLEMEQKLNQKRKSASNLKKSVSSTSPSKGGRGRSKVANVIQTPKQVAVKEKSAFKPSIMRKINLKSPDVPESVESANVEPEKVVIPIISDIVIKQEPVDEVEEAPHSEELEEEEEEEPMIIESQEDECDENTVIYVVQEEVIIDDNGQFVTAPEPIIIEDPDESFLLDGASQPLHDHCYSYSSVPDETTHNSEREDGVVEDAQEGEDIEFPSDDIGLDEVVIELGHDMDSSELERIATMAAQTASTPKEILQNIRSAVVSSNKQLDQYRHFNAFPNLQAKNRKQTSNAILASEEELYAAVEDDPDEDKDLIVGSQDWERRMAMKYIRLLRTKKKDERIPLVCKICKDKTFTAQATLMYHYRSHAGIKPFTCTICNTSFTRQHSLNYHMLIHNNRSRFTCGDCGRKFRHPSHFKEHMRRHTGETPFVCDDCGTRFKTRNTYKRHLKTRHGKLLTATGIHTLSEEEFNKVRTNPKRRMSTIPIFNRQRDMETQWPEPEHIGVEAADVTPSDQLVREAVEAYGSSHQNGIIEMVGDEGQADDDDDGTTIEIYGDPNLGQTIKVLTADGQLIDVKVVERKPEYDLVESEMGQQDEDENAAEEEAEEEEEEEEATENNVAETSVNILTTEDIQGVDLQPILECIDSGTLWE